MGRSDVFLQKAPVSFDASVQEMFNSLACGGLLLLAAPGGERDTQYLARLCKAERVTCCSFVPSQLDVLLQVSVIPVPAMHCCCAQALCHSMHRLLCRSLTWAPANPCAMCWWAARRCHPRLRRASRSACRMRTCTMRTGQPRPLWMPQVAPLMPPKSFFPIACDLGSDKDVRCRLRRDCRVCWWGICTHRAPD